ncbi:rCG53047 [Rattus norvegicus]|uniref:RCG53047 n=1 Tax=Rattus norvegicus TaxID=10116 RepID=A6KPZ6_RAT|nr:rCG53047 [Rattus norvegicus]
MRQHLGPTEQLHLVPASAVPISGCKVAFLYGVLRSGRLEHFPGSASELEHRIEVT